MAGKLVILPGSPTPVWDVAGDGSQGYVTAIAVVPAGAGRLVTRPGTSTPVWDVAGDGSQGYIEAVALLT